MKIGYPCVNWSIGCTSNKKFRIKSFSEEKFNSTVKNNLECLDKIVDYNIEHNLLFLRISSETIPFASHDICKIDWQNNFKKELEQIGKKLKQNNFRVSMHPGQFTVINSPNEEVVRKSISELQYHSDFLNLLQVDNTAKIQIHVGGVYGNKDAAIERFIKVYNSTPKEIKDRLAIENDDKHYSVDDCMIIFNKTEIPIILDNFHLECLNNGESLLEAYNLIENTWGNDHGVPMLDYSSQQPSARIGKHADHIDIQHFKEFMKIMKGKDADVIFEIKDKERSVLEAKKYL